MFTSIPITINKAKKNHRCDWCGGKILKGDSYKKWFCVNDNIAMDVKSHSECLEASYKSEYPEDTYFDRSHTRGQTDD